MRIKFTAIVWLACLAAGVSTTSAQQANSGPLDWSSATNRGQFIGPLDGQTRPQAVMAVEPALAPEWTQEAARPMLEPLTQATPIASHSVLVGDQGVVQQTSNLTLVPTLAPPRESAMEVPVRPVLESDQETPGYPMVQQQILDLEPYAPQVGKLYSPLDGPYVQFAGMPTVLPGFGACDCCDEWENFGACGGLKANPGHLGIPWLRSKDDCDQAQGRGCRTCRSRRW